MVVFKVKWSEAFKSVAFLMRQTWVFSYVPFSTSSKHSSLLSQFCYWCLETGLFRRCPSAALVRSVFSAFTTDEGFKFSPKKSFWLNNHLPHVKSHVISLTTIFICRLCSCVKWKAHGVVEHLGSQFGKKLPKLYGTW